MTVASNDRSIFGSPVSIGPGRTGRKLRPDAGAPTPPWAPLVEA